MIRDCGLVRSRWTRRTEVPTSSFGRFHALRARPIRGPAGLPSIRLCIHRSARRPSVHPSAIRPPDPSPGDCGGSSALGLGRKCAGGLVWPTGMLAGPPRASRTHLGDHSGRPPSVDATSRGPTRGVERPYKSCDEYLANPPNVSRPARAGVATPTAHPLDPRRPPHPSPHRSSTPVDCNAPPRRSCQTASRCGRAETRAALRPLPR